MESIEQTITLPKKHSLPADFYWQEAVQNDLAADPTRVLEGQALEQYILKKYQGLMPLPWIVKQIEKAKARQQSLSVDTVQRAKVFSVLEFTTFPDIEVTAGIRHNYDNEKDISRVVVFDGMVMKVDDQYKRMMLRETITPVLNQYNII